MSTDDQRHVRKIDQVGDKSLTPGNPLTRGRVTNRLSNNSRQWIVFGFVGITIAGLGAGRIFYRFKSGMDRDNCAHDLQEIGSAIGRYANDHGGQYPDSFATLVQHENLSPACFVCPSSDQTCANPATKATVADVVDPAHDSYRYSGARLTEQSATADTVVAFEPVDNHGDGCHVLFGDGSVRFVDRRQAIRIAAEAGRH